jgi:hypothetical protein
VISRTTPTAKCTPNMWYLALGFTVFMDCVTVKEEPEPTNSRKATRSLVATSVQNFLPQR